MAEETPNIDPTHAEHLTSPETAQTVLHWTEQRISDVRKSHSIIPDGPSAILTEQLKGALTEGALTAGELTKLAKQLIGAMLPASAKSSGQE